MSKVDISKPYIEAINEFIDPLNVQQLRVIESNAAYISGRYYYSKKEYKVAFSKLLKSIIGGKSRVIIRAIIFLIIITFKQLARVLKN